jgi:hypothetical protein
LVEENPMRRSVRTRRCARAAAQARAVTFAFAAALSLAPAARAEIPALTREFVTEDFRSTPDALQQLAQRRHVALGIAGGALWAGDDAGSWQAFRGGSPWGARAEALASYGRCTLGANATNDGSRNADAREYGQRITGAVHVPEMRTALTGAVGYERWHHRGTDLSAEFAPIRWHTHLRTMDLVPNVHFWTRYRKLEGDDKAIVTPAAGIALQHFVVFGSQPVLALSAQSDLSSGRTPSTCGMFQFGFASVPRPLTGGGADPDMPPAPGTPPPSLIDRNWFVTLAYAAPFDQRSSARFGVLAGLRFVRPYGGS